MEEKSLRYSIFYTPHGPRLALVDEECMDDPCCGGTECGLDFKEARKLMVAYFLGQLSYWEDAPEEDILENELGYREEIGEES